MVKSNLNAAPVDGRVEEVDAVSKPQVFNVRGRRVVLDREVAAYVGIDTKYLKKVVRRNLIFFEGDNFVFELTSNENLKLQTELCGDKFVSSKTDGRGGSRYLPFAFTAEGVSMLEKVLKRSIPIEFGEEIAEVEILPESWNEGTVVLYQPNDDIKIDVRVENETVWLTQEQMAQLFGTTTQNITIHIGNIFEEKEVEERATCKDFLQVQMEGGREVRRTVKLYNLDIIISVGYRVKSVQGTRFRQWALKVLKSVLLHRHYYDSRLDAYDHKLYETDKRLDNLEGKVDFIIKANISPKAGILKGNTVYDAHVFVSDLIEKANRNITLIDPYIDSSVLVLLTKRKKDVSVSIYHNEHNLRNKVAFFQDLELHNKQYPTITVTHVELLHDRFLITDDEVYYIGSSIKDLGKKMFSFGLIPFTETDVLNKIGVNTDIAT